MKKLFFLLACVVMSLLSYGQDNQLVWANGRLLYGTPIVGMDSLTYDEMEDVDTLHLLLPRVLMKYIHDTIVLHETINKYVYDTIYIVDKEAGIGVFSVSETNQVTFSKGNLQYIQSTNTWSFAENQYDYIGEDNFSLQSYDTILADKIDFFGWSADNTTAPFGVNTSTYHDDYYGSFVDWGSNQISNDAPNTWRTLTGDEWEYLLLGRNKADSLCGIAQVNGINGLVVLPDSWECPAGITFRYGFSYMEEPLEFSGHQSFTASQWSKLETSGAVFLPAAGFRLDKVTHNIEYRGYYWGASSILTTNAHYLILRSTDVVVKYLDRNRGLSVRLVKDL